MFINYDTKCGNIVSNEPIKLGANKLMRGGLGYCGEVKSK